MRIALILVSLIGLLNCTGTEKEAAKTSALPFSILLEPQPDLVYEYLRLVPIAADAMFVKDQEPITTLIGLEQAIEMDRFRITEKKPYGRFDDEGAVNLLTVQNKTEHQVLLLAGEVIQGGLQDRILAEDRIIAARSITDLDVFCVEQGRWSASGSDSEGESESKSEVFAFKGYYQVAATEVRHAATKDQNQEMVWNEVAEIRAAHAIESPTQAYTELETATQYSELKKQYTQFFKDKLIDRNQVIGFVAVSGNRILGADLFGHPALFAAKYEAVLTSYIADAITRGSPPIVNEERLLSYQEALAIQFQQTPKLKWNGKWVHYNDL